MINPFVRSIGACNLSESRTTSLLCFFFSKNINDAYNLSRVDKTLEALSGCKYFSVLDMESLYLQVEMDEHL